MKILIRKQFCRIEDWKISEDHGWFGKPFTEELRPGIEDATEAWSNFKAKIEKAGFEYNGIDFTYRSPYYKSRMEGQSFESWLRAYNAEPQSNEVIKIAETAKSLWLEIPEALRNSFAAHPEIETT